MRIVIPPVVLAGRIVRIVAPVADLLEVEEWRGEWWEPSSVTISAASLAPVASEDLLLACGIEPAEHDTTAAASHAEIEEWLRATAPAPRSVDGPEPPRPDPATKRERDYPGNARFQRGRREGSSS